MGNSITGVKVKLTGTDGNAFALLGKCASEGRKKGVKPEVLDEFRKEATSGDYNHLLATCMKYFDVR